VRLTVSDVVSPSCFVATAAVELGFFKAEGLEVEFVSATTVDSPVAFRDGEIDFIGASPYAGLSAMPGWRGARLLCALSQYTYWFLAMRADLGIRRGDVNALKGRRINAAGRPGLALKRVLEEAGLDLDWDGISIVSVPNPPGSWARIGADAIEQGIADGFWGNAMRAEYAVRRGLANVVLDIRRGDGPAVAREFTFPALITTDHLIEERPEAAAGCRACHREDPARAGRRSVAGHPGRLAALPPEELELIADLIARDAEFYDARISERAVEKAVTFAHEMGMLSAPISYRDIVATQLAELWTP
jgi:ABC-type nitrate/sulfonate/bicarbonate transport system substrate-binding protein